MNIRARIENIAATLTAGKYWAITGSLLLTAVALFFAFPSYTDINTKEWQPLFEKAANPFANGSYADGTHAAKLSFRLVVPLLVHYTGLGMVGVLVLLGLVGILNFYFVLKLAQTILQNKQQAFIIGLCSAFIYFGKCSFIELRGTMFDGLAIGLLLAAMLTSVPLLTALFVFISAWCDERGLIASALVWLYFIIRNDDAPFIKRIFSTRALTIYVAWIGYAMVRYILASENGLHTDMQGVGIGILLNQINNIPIGTWSGLEGLWLIVVFAMLVQWRNGQYTETLLYIAACGTIVLLGLCVVDITRSVVYVFPALFIALQMLQKHTDKPILDRLLWYALLLCFAYPAYYTGGKSSIWWTYPLPLQLLR